MLFYIFPLLPCIIFVLPYFPVPSTYPLYFLVSSLYFHISPCSSTYTLYSPVSSFYSHVIQSPSTYTPSYLSYRLCYLIYPLALLHIPYTPLYRVKETDLMLIANGLVPAIELDSSHLSTSPLSSAFARINAFR